MKKRFLIVFLLIGSMSLQSLTGQVKMTEENILAAKSQISQNIDKWHMAAANTNFDEYFGLMTDDAVFIGTDATENWQLEDFKKFCKPYFDSGKAWNFRPIERHIYLGDHRKFAWFDELLDTHMGICRGSGVMQKIGKQWKIQHYVLSMAIPNEDVSQVTLIKKDFDRDLTSKLQKN